MSSAMAAEPAAVSESLGGGYRWPWVCPACREPRDSGSCDDCGLLRHGPDGIVRALLPERAAALAGFLRDYREVRRREGWGSDYPAYYRDLPAVPADDPYAEIWRIRTISLRALLADRSVALGGVPQRVLDLGAGNLWLTHCLTGRGHHVLAVDLDDDPRDGLGARRHYTLDLLAAQAEYDHLPLADGAADVVIYNGAFHYSTDYATTLTEAVRVLAPGGRIVVMDTAIYRDRASGEQMVAERRARFQATYGFASDQIASEDYLTWSRIEELGRQLHLSWRIVKPFYSFERWLRPWRHRLLGGRERSTFALLIATPEDQAR